MLGRAGQGAEEQAGHRGMARLGESTCCSCCAPKASSSSVGTVGFSSCSCNPAKRLYSRRYLTESKTVSEVPPHTLHHPSLSPPAAKSPNRMAGAPKMSVGTHLEQWKPPCSTGCANQWQGLCQGPVAAPTKRSYFCISVNFRWRNHHFLMRLSC